MEWNPAPEQVKIENLEIIIENEEGRIRTYSLRTCS